ncbi:MAG TPA: M2 family metallopeptidase [Actinomycetota bacterium]|nr:M2 family metallopeptidase [Actinomycetota bacterium]
MRDAERIVGEAEDRLRPLHLAAARSWWDANVEATEGNERRRVEAELALSDALADATLFGAVEDARSNGAEGLVARQLTVLRASLVPNQVPESLRHRIVELEASVESRFANHRGVVRGEHVDDNGIKRILRSSDDVAERREAWEASKTVGAAVADDVRELARLRNEAARSLGYRDWFALAVSTSEMDEGRLFETLDECDSLTAQPFSSWKAATDALLAERFGCAVSDLAPWHYEDPFFQEVPAAGGVDLDRYFAKTDVVALARATFEGIGLETEAILERSDLYPRDAKCQHAFCLDVDREGDVRVLANVAPDRYWADTMLHELGHGVFDLGIDRDLPWLLRDCHLTITEGIAIMMGRLAQDARWLRDVVGVDGDEAARLGADLDAMRAAEVLVFTRWVLVMTNFERAFYADPEADLSALWWGLVARYQHVTPPESRSDPDWAAKIHVACAPVYYHTYLYGQLVASQLRATLDRRAGGLVGRQEAGRLLTEGVFRPGQSVRWDRLVEQATGEPLTAAHLARDIAAVLPA